MRMIDGNDDSRSQHSMFTILGFTVSLLTVHRPGGVPEPRGSSRVLSTENRMCTDTHQCLFCIVHVGLSTELVCLQSLQMLSRVSPLRQAVIGHTATTLVSAQLLLLNSLGSIGLGFVFLSAQALQ